VTVDEGTVEVAHEALLREWPRLRGWLEEDAEGRRLHQHLIHAAGEWQGSGRDPAEVYRGARLASTLEWAASHGPELNELEREFLDEGRAVSDREAVRQRRTNRRLAVLLAGVGVLLAAAVVAGVIAISERQGARDAATAEAAQRLGAQALSEDRLDRAVLLANTGVALDDSVATRSSLLSVLLRNPAILGVLHSSSDDLYTLALSPDGRRLALGDRDGTVTLFDAETRERLGDYQAPGTVTGLAFDPQGRSLAVGAVGSLGEFTASLHILDAATLHLRTSTPLGRHPAARSLATPDYFPLVTYGPDGRSVIVGYANGGTHRLPLFLGRFDARTGAPLGDAVRVAPAGAQSAELVSAPDGRLLYATRDATYAIDPEALRVVRRYPVGGVSANAMDGSTLAIGGADGRVRLLDLASGQVQTLSGHHRAPVLDEAFSPGGRSLATAAADGTAIVWDLHQGRATERLKGHRDGVPNLAFSPDGRTLYTESFDSTAIIWDVAGDRRLGRPFTTGLAPVPYNVFPPAFAVSPDGRTLAVARLDGLVDLIDAATLRRKRSFEALHRTPATAIEYTPDGRGLAVAGGRGLIGLWDVDSGRRVGALLHAPPHGGPCAEPSTVRLPECNESTIQAVAVSRDGLLAAVGIGGDLRIWDLASRELVEPRLQVPPLVVGLAFSPDGSRLAAPFGLFHAGADGVEVLDPRSGERVAMLLTDNEVRSVAFSPDDQLLAAGQLDGGAVLWRTDGWQQVGPTLALREGGAALGVAFSPDSRTLAASHDDGTVVLWDVDSQQSIGSLPGPRFWTTARFSPDGRHLFAVSDNRRAVRWEVDPAAWRRQACVVAGGDLTPEEWEEIVPEQDYRSVCPAR
jgi:WD40 repeat protein